MGLYGQSARPRPPDPHAQAARRRRPSEPQASQFPVFIGEGMVLALYAVAGRLAWRRLSPVSRRDEQVILLDLRRGRQEDGETPDGPPR
jgi:hypothetical protein